jgi:phenylacetate-coenzyme A ligase PaaK-like adenylate-forming protein
MSPLTLRLFHRLPPFARNAAASVYGRRLRGWRYGAETERRVEEALERDAWDPARWRAWREERIARLLHRAATRVPFYREQWAERRRQGDRRSWERLENWPLLSKDDLRRRPSAFVADDCDTRRMYRERTSGTTGLPLEVWWSRETVRAWFAIYEARIRRWNGVDRADPWAILGGQPVVPATARRPPFWVWNGAMRQLYLSANHVAPATAASFFAEMEARRVTHLIGYPSSLAYLARQAFAQGVPPPSRLRVVVTNAEPLLPWQREAIAEGMGAEVRETYGMAEIAAAGSECARGFLHAWPEAGWIETRIEEEDRAAPAGTSGRFVATALLNPDMPLVRYVLGDRGRIAPDSPSPCACGRRLPVFSAIEGRSNDMLIAPDGRRVFWLNPVFYGMAIREAQIVQEAVESLRVLYVPAPGFDARQKSAIAQRLRDRMGEVTVGFEECEAIPRGANGKFRAIVCRVDADSLRPEARSARA